MNQTKRRQTMRRAGPDTRSGSAQDHVGVTALIPRGNGAGSGGLRGLWLALVLPWCCPTLEGCAAPCDTDLDTGGELVETDAEETRVLLQLGDSLTWRSGATPVYPPFLPELLAPYRTVGSVSVGWGYYVEGHSGYRTDQVLDELDVWTATYPEPPTDCLVLLGTNNVIQAWPTVETVADLVELEQRLEDDLGCDVHTGTPPTARGSYEWINVEAAELRAAMLASSLEHVVGLEWDPALHTDADGVHPNDAGARLLAEQWAAAL